MNNEIHYQTLSNGFVTGANAKTVRMPDDSVSRAAVGVCVRVFLRIVGEAVNAKIIFVRSFFDGKFNKIHNWNWYWRWIWWQNQSVVVGWLEKTGEKKTLGRCAQCCCTPLMHIISFGIQSSFPQMAGWWMYLVDSCSDNVHVIESTNSKRFISGGFEWKRLKPGNLHFDCDDNFNGMPMSMPNAVAKVKVTASK